MSPLLNLLRINESTIYVCGAQSPCWLQLVVDGHALPVHWVGDVQLHETAPNAFEGATSDAMTGSATIDARPIVLRT